MEAEPMFTIRAQDALGPAAVEAWALMAEVAAKATGVEHLLDQATQARDIGDDMRAWQAQHPELVKWPD
jgi:hypothetical protein